VLVVKGRVDHKEGESKLIAIEVTEFEALRAPTEVRLKVDARKAPAGVCASSASSSATSRRGEGRARARDLRGPRTLEFGPTTASRRCRTSTPR
jgi:hypothetical protein